MTRVSLRTPRAVAYSVCSVEAERLPHPTHLYCCEGSRPLAPIMMIACVVQKQSTANLRCDVRCMSIWHLSWLFKVTMAKQSGLHSRPCWPNQGTIPRCCCRYSCTCNEETSKKHSTLSRDTAGRATAMFSLHLGDHIWSI